jgi:hypothetical protein
MQDTNDIEFALFAPYNEAAVAMTSVYLPFVKVKLSAALDG